MTPVNKPKGADFLSALGGFSRVYLSGHENPDGDAASACFMMGLALLKLGYEPVLLLSKFSDKYAHSDGMKLLGSYDDKKPYAFVSLDCATKARIDCDPQVFEKAGVTINIDHHVSNERFADFNFVDHLASSTCELIYWLMKDFVEIDESMARAVYTGIVFDTGGFRHSSTRPETHIAAAELIEKGIPFAGITREVLHLKSLPEVMILSRALNSLKIDSGIAYATVTREDMNECGAQSFDLDGVPEFLLNIQGVHTSALLSRRKELVKISLRSTKLNVCKIAAAFGGGGHEKAAGASLSCELSEAVQKVIAKIKEAAEYEISV